MLYITGVHALNIECELDTTGDWHTSALSWDAIKMRDTIARKGVEQFDYLSETQEDELIDREKLQYMFMTMWELLGLN